MKKKYFIGKDVWIITVISTINSAISLLSIDKYNDVRIINVCGETI